MFWGETQIPKVQKLGVQKRIVFLSVGGGVDQLRFVCPACSIVFLKSRVSCQALATVLKQNSSLTNLFLEGNKIGDEGAKAWCLVCSVRMVSRGEKSVKKGKGRVNAQLFDSKVRQ